MLTITIELLGGTIRLGSADDLALTGEEDTGEWPPSPARLFSALVAADGTGPRCHVTTGAELLVLEQASPPLILADPIEAVLSSPLARRFVVVNERCEGSVQNYPARSAAEVRPGSRLSPATPVVEYRWPDLALDPVTVQALRLRAARVGYLGCADSAVRLRVSDSEDPCPVADLATWEPVGQSDEGAVALPVAFPGLVGILDHAFERFTAGEPVRRSWFPARRHWYRIPRPGGNVDGSALVVWLRFDSSVPGRLALGVTDTLRRATLELYDRWALQGSGELPQVLTGHGFAGEGYQHAHWLALPEVDHEHAKGRLHGAALWLPPQTDPDIARGVRHSLAHLNELVIPGGRRIGVRLSDGRDGPFAARPRRWRGPARVWSSALPVVHERWGPVSLAEVGRWCAHAGLPRPVRFRTSRLPLVQGALSLAPAEVFRAGSERRPFSHLSVEFADAVYGPVVLGRARQFGMGLMCPAGRGGSGDLEKEDDDA